MPKLDGYEATKQIRHDDDADVSSTPIIAVSAQGLDRERQRALDVGMNEYLVKPIRRSSLRRSLRRWLDRDRTDDPEDRSRDE